MAELTQVHASINPAGKPHIVFVHGLDGDFRTTWMSNHKDDGTLWPKWLGEDIDCSVWLLGYGSAMSRWRADAMPLPLQATAVLQCLSTKPSLMEGPLVLVGHSLGGLVIKTALNQGLGGDVDRYGRLSRNIKGIAFVGTPHFGSMLASIIANLHFMRPNPQVRDLRMDDAHLQELNQFFLKHCRELDLKTRVFIETQPVRLPSWLGGRFLPGLTIVSPTSSQAHIPGEVGIPIEANHLSICKPKNRKAAIYRSMYDFIKEIEAGSHLQQSQGFTEFNPLPSERFDAMRPEDRPITPVHLAFSVYGFKLHGNADASVCASVCLVTDEPDRLCNALHDIRRAVCSDPLVPESTKKASLSVSLEQLTQNPSARDVMLRLLAVTSFSAYLYYCPKNAFDQLSPQDRLEYLLIAPLRSRMIKKSEHIKQYHTRQADMSRYLEEAASGLEQACHLMPVLPRVGETKYSILEELATLLVTASCTHLGDLADGGASALFESLRTRIRYAENVVTSEKHKRDVNPLP